MSFSISLTSPFDTKPSLKSGAFWALVRRLSKERRYDQASVLVGAVLGVGKGEDGGGGHDNMTTCPALAEVFEWPFIGPCFSGQVSMGLNVSVGKALPCSLGCLLFFLF